MVVMGSGQRGNVRRAVDAADSGGILLCLRIGGDRQCEQHSEEDNCVGWQQSLSQSPVLRTALSMDSDPSRIYWRSMGKLRWPVCRIRRPMRARIFFLSDPIVGKQDRDRLADDFVSVVLVQPLGAGEAYQQQRGIAAAEEILGQGGDDALEVGNEERLFCVAGAVPLTRRMPAIRVRTPGAVAGESIARSGMGRGNRSQTPGQRRDVMVAS